jgi:hypothetical protein
MRARKSGAVLSLGLALLGIGFAQKPFRQYLGIEYDDFPLPDDARENAEFVFARLRYRSVLGFRGMAPDYWTMDYPRSDRHLTLGLRRLTRIQTRGVEQVADFDNDLYNWPFLYGVEVGHWVLNDANSEKLRDYLLRGGFLMVDDFHGTQEWDMFMASMSRVFPNRPVVEIDNKDPIFHSVYDLDDRFQVPGAQYLRSGRSFEYDGFEARWRGIYDDKGRLIVAICHNMDLGDAWEHSDNPRYPEKWASLAYRIAVNYAIYAMTH